MFKVVASSDMLDQPLRMALCCGLLMSENLKYTVEYDTAKAMSLTGGKMHPLKAYVILNERDEYIGTTVYDLCKYIEEKGLRQA